MKIYVASYNGVLDEYKSQIRYAPPLDADKLVIWQDCVGSFGEMVKMSKKFFPKPIYTVQHGRRASRDYDKPLLHPFQSDMFLAWGKWDHDNMTRMGFKSEIVGCPLNTLIKPKIQHKEKVILFVPVNTGKEEPDNIRVYAELMKMKLTKMQDGLTARYDELRAQWNSEKLTNHTLANDFTVLTKVLPWHDQKFYTDGFVKGFQDSKRNNEKLFDILRNVDLVVGLDEGTTELFAVTHDVPVIVVDGFQYRWKEGRTEVPRTPGFTHCDLEGLQEAIEYVLDEPNRLKDARRWVAENEMSIDSIKNPTSRIHEIIGSSPRLQ